MNRCQPPAQYPLDSSAVIHLAALKPGHSNLFRLTAVLTEPVRPVPLQAAVNRITPRFPTIAARLQRRFFDYAVVPMAAPPAVQPDRGCLAAMTEQELAHCALRILYTENRIAVEIFHSLTDGYGGMIFLKTLLAEYLRLTHSVLCPFTDGILDPDAEPQPAELADDYQTYAAAPALPSDSRASYSLPGERDPSASFHAAIGAYPLPDLLHAAHTFGVSLTAFLTGVMAEAVLILQAEDPDSSARLRPVRIMVPINLRRCFASQSLRNFTLYALPCLRPEDHGQPFAQMVRSLAQQIKAQSTQAHLASMMGANVSAQRMPLFRMLPLPAKLALLRAVFRRFGERVSCLSVSNLGAVSFPPQAARYLDHVEFSLSPRRNAPYNCGVVSFGGKLHLSITRGTADSRFEELFWHCLEKRLLQSQKRQPV